MLKCSNEHFDACAVFCAETPLAVGTLSFSSCYDQSVAETHQCLFGSGQFRIGPALIVAEFDFEDSVGEFFHHGSYLPCEEPGFG